MSQPEPRARSRSVEHGPIVSCLLTALGGGVTFALAAPPTDVYPAVVVGLAALYVATVRLGAARWAALAALVWATAAGIVGMRFIPAVITSFTDLGKLAGVAALVLLSAFQGLAWAAAAALASVAVRRARLDARVAFGGAVLLAISLPAVIVWSPAGLLSPWPVLVQAAELIGERGVSFVLAVATASCVTPLVVPAAGVRRFIAPAGGVALFLTLLGYGAVRLPRVAADLAGRPTLTVGIVQQAIPARLRWEAHARRLILARLHDLTLESERRGAELTIWPEAAYPYVLPHHAGLAPRDQRALLGRGVRGPVLFGTITSAPNGDGQHNSATLIDRSGRLQQPQAKLQLLWFGETVPLGEYLPFLRRVFSRTGGLVPGTDVALLEHAGWKVGVLNCYEDTLPGVGRRVARARPNLLVNVTNDAWFGPTAEPELHLRLAAMRAIETRRDLVRAVNLGVPAWIDASGVVRARGRADAPSVLLATPAQNDMSPTLYVEVGDIPLWLGLALATLIAAVRGRRASRADTEPGPRLAEPLRGERRAPILKRDR